MVPANKNRSGVTAVETAFVLPVVFILLFAAIDFARVSNIRNTAATVTYEGARCAILPGKSEQDVLEIVQKGLADLDIAGATILIEPTVITEETPQVTVTVSVPLSQNLYASSAVFDGQTIESSCSLTRESALVELIQ